MNEPRIFSNITLLVWALLRSLVVVSNLLSIYAPKLSVIGKCCDCVKSCNCISPSILVYSSRIYYRVNEISHRLASKVLCSSNLPIRPKHWRLRLLMLEIFPIEIWLNLVFSDVIENHVVQSNRANRCIKACPIISIIVGVGTKWSFFHDEERIFRTTFIMPILAIHTLHVLKMFQSRHMKHRSKPEMAHKAIPTTSPIIFKLVDLVLHIFSNNPFRTHFIPLARDITHSDHTLFSQTAI